MKPFLSVCMIVKNEEAALGRCLASIVGLDAEIIVVDTGSTDRTVEVAEAGGATVHRFAWIDDFAAARNHAMSLAAGTWILALDADEELSAALRANLRGVLDRTKATAIRLPASCIDDSGEVQTTMWTLRLVRNGQGYAFEGRIHEVLDESVTRLGGSIIDVDALPFSHHGYTSAETLRKDRQTRNRTLLESAHAAEPEEPRYWHYLGAQLQAEGDFVGAARHLDRVLERAPNHPMAAWSAHTLAQIHEVEGDLGTAWSIAQLGTRGNVGRLYCLMQLGDIALREGDAESALGYAQAIEEAPEDGIATRVTTLEHAAVLRAGARLLVEPRSGKARDALLAALRAYPRNARLADMLVKACEAMEGTGKGTRAAARLAGYVPAVTAASMGAYHRGGAPDACIEIGKESGVRSEEYAFAVASMGRLDEARAELLAFGDSAELAALVFGIAHDDDELLARGLGASSAKHRDALACVREGAPVVPSSAWILRGWLERAVALRADRAVARLLASLPVPVGRRAALHALLAFDLLGPIAGLTIALGHPTELDSQEVIGLVAHRQGDWEGARSMLSLRAQRADASVRVYAKASDACARLGRAAEADRWLALGREARPHALGLVAPRRARPVHPSPAPRFP